MDNNFSEIVKRCESCNEFIDKKSKICNHCRTYQGTCNKIKNLLFNYSIPLLLSIISIGQVYISHLNYQESKRKRIEASDIYKKAEDTLLEATKKAEIANYKSEESLKKSISISDKIELVENQTNIKVNDINKKIELALDETNELKITFNKELSIIKERNELLRLADDCITNMSRKSYEKLKGYLNKSLNNDDKNMVVSEILKVKSSFLTTKRTGNYELELKTGTKEKDIVTDLLVLILNDKSSNWASRVRAADILKDRREKESIDSIYNCIINDNNLAVLKECIQTFSHLSGYKKSDVLDHEDIVDWWYKNKNDVYQKLKDNKK